MNRIPSPIQDTALFDLRWMRVKPKISQAFGNYLGGRYRAMGYSMDHPGIDIAVSTGTPIFCPIRGKVRYAPKNKGYGIGCYVTDGVIEILLCHMSKIYVKDGERVESGQLIGLTGNTGNSSGPHLHYGYRVVKRGQDEYQGWVDPAPLTLCWKGSFKNNTI